MARATVDAPKRLWRVGGQVSVAIAVVLLSAACGKKGPPLPPLVKMPVAPAELAAERRGDRVDVHFIVPATNTDGTRPANIAHAEVYAITMPATSAPVTYTDAQILKYGTKVGTVDIKAPRDPNLTADADEPSDEVDEPEGAGLDQGAVAHLAEPMASNLLRPADVPPDPTMPATAPPPEADEGPHPLLGPTSAVVTRAYAAVGISTRGRKGPVSRRIVVPLVPPPPPPEEPTITYAETAVTVSWPPSGATRAASATDDVLPSRAVGAASPSILYNVYDVTDPDAPVKLTAAPIAAATFNDTRIVWDEERCYAIRAAERIGTAVIESDASPAACETPVDTFPPAAPKGLAAIASEGAINLIWEPNSEADLDGYLVLRAIAPSETLEPITPAPIKETSLRDGVEAGLRYVYAVVAVDKAGNQSPPSPRVTETAR